VLVPPSSSGAVIAAVLVGRLVPAVLHFCCQRCILLFWLVQQVSLLVVGCSCWLLEVFLVAGLLYLRLGYGVELWCSPLDFKDIAFAIFVSCCVLGDVTLIGGILYFFSFSGSSRLA
jgi:hypothetical protein